ncbi:17283_t:CDS:2 [Dentiscutata erythropus]|uniref:methionyl-tRNA formyltransferase n=1 Tax=Dentiscutata erythropus TaxID=1348616 RepID=A0A9N9CEZ5_9GLOM|nr:17283_t:CDS:2 [Dentiscutata erythropus]
MSSRFIIHRGETNNLKRSIEVVVPPDRRTGRGLKTITQSTVDTSFPWREKNNYLSFCEKLTSFRPVKLFAQDNNLVIHEAPQKTLQAWKIPKPRDLEAIHFDIDRFDIGVVVSFGYFLSPAILESFKKGSMNVHPSLLPKYRGAAPIQYAILNGDQETGITIQELHPEIFDAGKILRQISVAIPSESTYQSLESILAAEGAELLVDTLRYLDYFQANAQEQDTTKATKAPKISKDMAEIKWNQITADRLDKLYHSIYVICNDDKLIECRSVKMEGKNKISVKDWINGYGVENGKMKFESL